MAADRAAIWAQMELLAEADAARSGTRMHWALARAQADLESIASLLPPPQTRLQDMKSSRMRSRRIHDLRLLLKAFGRPGFLVLRQAASEVSTSPYRLILRDREVSERPNGDAIARISEREWQTYRVAQRVLRLADRADISQRKAFEHVRARERLNKTYDTFKQHLKELSAASKARGYTDPLAPSIYFMLGANSVEEVIKPKLSVERMARRGRPRKKR